MVRPNSAKPHVLSLKAAIHRCYAKSDIFVVRLLPLLDPQLRDVLSSQHLNV